MSPRFRVGATVIYPFHGVAKIIARELRTVDGVTSTYLRLAVAEREVGGRSGLIVSVPLHRVSDVGLRWPVSREDASAVLDVLARVDVNVPSGWSRRFKNHQEKLKSGDPFECAEVVRNLSERLRVKRLAAAETSMYSHARHALISELALSWNVDALEAEARIDGALER